MPQKHDRLLETELDAVYYHLITAQQSEPSHALHRLTAVEPQPEPSPELDYEFHPADLADLVAWEKQISRHIALWLLLMTVVTLVILPYAPLFTPLFALLFAILSLSFYARSGLIHSARVLRDVYLHRQRPIQRWMGGSFALASGILAYYVALIVPYSIMPIEVRTLLFFVAMNLAIYIPIVIIRVIRERGLRRKRRMID